ncbi:GGDEF domain-containing protein [Altericroceibacterium endophyticum]|uniref:diguanylate cyclase n=1 Tax=Altericroceibacterium endophyticum TaxID=1808508 RepID=A0A6I4SZX9_9SPHN|nr:GGDEF domain-containing protein [Altericroceibacterium endophyticum]MXO64176.1 diguanylate cyclase [Altericroceibacterium endophyticum]
MDNAVVNVALFLIGPGIMLGFCLAFIGVWAVDRRRSYLLLLGLTCLIFVLSSLLKTVHWPHSTNLNTLVTGTLLSAVALLAVQAILMRSHREFHWSLYPTLLSMFWAVSGYFLFVDENFLARISIRNAGYGLLFLITAWRLRELPPAHSMDRALFWAVLLFALHFFPRTLLEIGLTTPAGEVPMGNYPYWNALQLVVTALRLGLTLAIFAAALADLLAVVRRQQTTDPLTGALNRTGFEEAAAASIANRVKSASAASLVICDLDYFKRINDVYGHDVGDDVLRAFGLLLRGSVGPDDIVGRYEGEKIVIFMPSTDLEDAAPAVERLRIAVAKNHFPHLRDGELLTASFGVAGLVPDECWSSLFKRAQKCLSVAKKAGRNRCVTTLDVQEELSGSSIAAFQINMHPRNSR